MPRINLVTAYLLALVLCSPLAQAQYNTNDEKPERGSVDIEISNFQAHVTVKKDGERTNGGADFWCGFNRSRKDPINRTETALLEAMPELLKANSIGQYPLSAPGEMVLINGERQKRRSFGKNQHWLNGWRNITISNQVSTRGQAQVIELGMKDVMKAMTPEQRKKHKKRRIDGSKEDCGHSDWIEYIVKDTLSGHIDISIEVPERVNFFKIEVLESSGVFTKINPDGNASRVSIVNGIHPELSYIAPTYAWYKDSEEGRIKIRYKFKSSYGIGRNGGTRESKLKIKVKPIQLPPSANLSEVFLNLTDLLEDRDVTEDQLVTDLGSLISNFRSGAGNRILNQKSLKDIREVQQSLFKFGISSAIEHDGFTPTTKAMSAVLATLVSEYLSEKLLKVCKVTDKNLVLTRQQVSLPGYYYITFYLKRVIDRLEAFESQKVYQFADILNEVEAYGMTCRDISQDSNLMGRLASTYDIYVELVSAAGQPLRASYGEIDNLNSDVGSFFQNSSHYNNIMNGLERAMQIERQIQVGINRAKKSVIRNPKAEAFTSFEVWNKVLELEEIKLEIIQSLQNFSQDSLFSEVTRGGVKKSMFEIFKGLNLREVDFPEGEEVYTFYKPIFEYFFNPDHIEKLNQDTQLCIQGDYR